MTRQRFIQRGVYIRRICVQRAWIMAMSCGFASVVSVRDVAYAQQTTGAASIGFVVTGASPSDSLHAIDTGMTVVALVPSNGLTLAAAVKAEVQKARAQGRTPFVELGAEWCAPCQELKALLEPPVDSGIADIFAGTYIIRFDIDKWNEQDEKTLGLVSPRGIPAFLAVDTNGVATAIMPGDEWGDNNVGGLQPLKQFFRQHLARGKDPNAASRKSHSLDYPEGKRSSTGTRNVQ